MNTRRVAATILAVALFVPLLIGATRLIGWGGDDARAGTADAQALRDFAGALRGSDDQTFTAMYTTAGGVVVTHAQEPPRRAYRSAAGLYLTAPDGTYMCRTPENDKPSCSRAAGTDEVPLGHARALSGVLDGDFVAPELVRAYLSRLATRVPGKVERTERVIAEQPTRCLGIPAVFTACATAAGVLAHFEAPDGTVTLTRYQPTAFHEVFVLPRGANVSDLESPN